MKTEVQCCGSFEPVADDESEEQNDGDSDDVYFVEAIGKRRHSEPPFRGGDSDCGAEVGREASGDGGIGKHVVHHEIRAGHKSCEFTCENDVVVLGEKENAEIETKKSIKGS